MGGSIFYFSSQPEALEQRALKIFEERLKKRGAVSDPECVITVVRSERCAGDEFRFSGSCGSKELRLDCGSAVAFLYAVGKLLRSGEYKDGIFTPGKWRGVWRPQKHYRCVYFASHFYNIYEVSPLEDIEEYIEDLALLGYNYFQLAVGSAAKIADSPETLNDLNRRRRLMKFAATLGMKILINVSNQGYADSPKELRAMPTKRSFFGTEICPSDPEGILYLQKKVRAYFESLKDIEVATVDFWPYDQGGCGCEKCFPYGINGMFKFADMVVPLIREYWPEAKIMWSTWLFDKQRNDGEWEGLYKKINNKEADFIDLIMADSHDSFPVYPRNNPLPGKVQLLTFPEISMWGRSPWGGFGATPLPQHFSKLFGEVAHISDGGVLYSEGIFEDFNKFLYANFFESGKNDPAESIWEYAHYELGLPDSAMDDFKRLLQLMEDNHYGLLWVEIMEEHNDLFEPLKGKIARRLKGKKWRGTGEMLNLAEKLDALLPDWSRTSWRWRLFYLRAVIDFELAHNCNEPTEITEKAMLELVDIYNVSPVTASRRVSPFTDEWLKYHVKEEYKLNRNNLGVD